MVLREAYIEFKDEIHKDGWFQIIELTSGYVTFLTSNNRISIPLNNVVKIKERGGDTE